MRVDIRPFQKRYDDSSLKLIARRSSRALHKSLHRILRCRPICLKIVAGPARAALSSVMARQDSVVSVAARSVLTLPEAIWVTIPRVKITERSPKSLIPLASC